MWFKWKKDLLFLSRYKIKQMRENGRLVVYSKNMEFHDKLNKYYQPVSQIDRRTALPSTLIFLFKNDA